MARIARVVIPEMPHHIVQRGVRSMSVFFSDSDRRAYLDFLLESANRCGVSFWAWSLMTNHVHLIAVPKNRESLSRAIGEAHRRYTRMVNFREGVRGHLFQERYHSYPVQKDRHLAAACRYVELNPVKAGIVDAGEEYMWSSARFNMGKVRTDPLVRKRVLEEMFGPWRQVLKDGERESEGDHIELQLRTGRPYGGTRWIRSLEKRLGRDLTAKKGGWPKGRSRSAKGRD